MNVNTQEGHFDPSDIFNNISQTTAISIMNVCGTFLMRPLRDILMKKNSKSNKRQPIYNMKYEESSILKLEIFEKN